jgi:DNA mismatch repair protein MutS
VEQANKIVFLHKVEEGAAHMSYGIQVAQLAGIPKSVVAAAKRKLTQLEDSQYKNQQIAQNTNQPDMFAAEIEMTEAPQHPVIAELETIQPDDLTPKQALEFLYQIKALADKS